MVASLDGNIDQIQAAKEEILNCKECMSMNLCIVFFLGQLIVSILVSTLYNSVLGGTWLWLTFFYMPIASLLAVAFVLVSFVMYLQGPGQGAE
jgi:hypothetical protein